MLTSLVLGALLDRWSTWQVSTEVIVFKRRPFCFSIWKIGIDPIDAASPQPSRTISPNG